MRKQISQEIPGQAASIILMCVGSYLAGEYGKWSNISWEGIVGAVMVLSGFFLYIMFSEIKDAKREDGGRDNGE